MSSVVPPLPAHVPGRPPYHIGIATHDLESSMVHFGKLFGLTWGPLAEGAERGLATTAGPVSWTCRRVHSRGGSFHVELLEGSPGSTWATDQLAVVHHVAFWSDDVAGEVRELVAAGWDLELTLVDSSGEPSEFAYLAAPGAVRIELVASTRRERYELAVQE